MSWTNTCLFCIDDVDQATCSEIVTKNPKNVDIQPLLHYLAGVDPSSDGSPGSRIPVMAQLPPLCVPCYEKLGQLHQLHQNLLEIQRLIQHVALEMRRGVRECRIVAEGKGKSKLDTFLYKLRKVSKTPRDIFPGSIDLEDLHDLIIGEGSNDVIFPSRWKPAPSSEAPVTMSTTKTEGDPDPLMTFIEQQDISMDMDDQDGRDYQNHLEYELGNFIKVELEPAPADDNYDNFNSDDHDDADASMPMTDADVDDLLDPVDGGNDESHLRPDNNDGDLELEATGRGETSSKKKATETEPKRRKSKRVTKTRKKGSDESDILSDGDVRDEDWDPKLKYKYTKKKGKCSKKKSEKNIYKFSCQFCNKLFVTVYERYRHYKRDHGEQFVDNGKVPCPKTDEDILQNCKFCDKMIPTTEMKIHLTTAHKKRVSELVFIKCKLCNEELVDSGDREEYQNHLQRRHNEPRPCDLCESEVFDRSHDLRKHYYHIHQIGSQYICEHCSGTFYTEEYLRAHIRKQHNETQGNFPCEFCLKSGDTKRAYLGSKKLLEKHLAKAHPVDRYKCGRPQCTAQFRCKADFLEHVETMHAGKGKRRSRIGFIIKCSVCGKEFHSVGHLKTHASVHSNEKTFQCEQCPKAFKTEQNFKRHQLTHLPGGRPRPFICEVCSRAFFDAKLLEQHVRIHTGERPFPCQFCGMAFRQKCSLRAHELGHKNKQENFRSTGTFERGAKGN